MESLITKVNQFSAATMFEKSDRVQKWSFLLLHSSTKDIDEPQVYQM